MRSVLVVVLVIFSVALVIAPNESRASMIGTTALSETSNTIQFSSWRLGSGNLSSHSTSLVAGASTRSLTSNVGYTLRPAAVTSYAQSSYTFRPNRADMASAVDYSYAAITQRVSHRHGGRRHRGGVSSVGTTLAVAAVPDTASSLALLMIALGGFATLRILTVAGRLARA